MSARPGACNVSPGSAKPKLQPGPGAAALVRFFCRIVWNRFGRSGYLSCARVASLALAVKENAGRTPLFFASHGPGTAKVLRHWPDLLEQENGNGAMHTRWTLARL